MVLPFQIQANREKRDWSQAELGERAGMLRNAISRLESVDYGNLSINTLIRLARAFDFGLLVKFVPFSRLVTEFEDLSPSVLEVTSFGEDSERLREWATRPEQAPHVGRRTRPSRAENQDQLNLFDWERGVFVEVKDNVVALTQYPRRPQRPAREETIARLMQGEAA